MGFICLREDHSFGKYMHKTFRIARLNTRMGEYNNFWKSSNIVDLNRVF